MKTLKYISIFIVFTMSNCSLKKNHVISGKVSGDPNYKNSIQSINILRLIPRIYPELGYYNEPLNKGSLNPRYSSRSFTGSSTFIFDNGDVVFISHWNGRMLFLKFTEQNYLKPSKIMILSNLLNDTLKGHSIYKTMENLHTTNDLSILQVGNTLIFQLDSCLISLSESISINAIKSMRMLHSEIKLPGKAYITFRNIQKIGTGKSFVFRNEVDLMSRQKKENIELLIELDDSLRLVRQEYLPVLDFGRWYYFNEFTTNKEKRMREYYLDGLFPRKGKDSIKIDGKTFHFLTAQKQVKIDDLFKIDQQYYYFSNGFISDNDFAFKKDDEYFVKYSRFTISQIPHKHYTKIVTEEEENEYIQDSIHRYLYKNESINYVNETTMAVKMNPKLMVTPIDFTDTVIYDYLNATSLFGRNYTDVSVSKKVGNYSTININRLDNNLITAFNSGYYYSYLLQTRKYEDPFPFAGGIPKSPIYNTIIFNSRFNRVTEIDSKVGLSENISPFPRGYASLYSDCNNTTKSQPCEGANKANKLQILFHDTLYRRDTLLTFVDNYYMNNGLFSKQSIVKPFRTGLRCISVSSDGFKMETTIIAINEYYKVNNNDFLIELSHTGNGELSIKIEGNGLYQFIPTKFWLNPTKPDSGIYSINNIPLQARKFDPEYYNNKLVIKPGKSGKKYPQIWEDRLDLTTDSLYRFKLKPGVYYLATQPIYPENINYNGISRDVVGVTDVYDGFGRWIYGDKEGTFDDKIFIRHQFKIVVNKNGKVTIQKLPYKF